MELDEEMNEIDELKPNLTVAVTLSVMSMLLKVGFLFFLWVTMLKLLPGRGNAFFVAGYGLTMLGILVLSELLHGLAAVSKYKAYASCDMLLPASGRHPVLRTVFRFLALAAVASVCAFGTILYFKKWFTTWEYVTLLLAFSGVFFLLSSVLYFPVWKKEEKASELPLWIHVILHAPWGFKEAVLMLIGCFVMSVPLGIAVFFAMTVYAGMNYLAMREKRTKVFDTFPFSILQNVIAYVCGTTCFVMSYAVFHKTDEVSVIFVIMTVVSLALAESLYGHGISYLLPEAETEEVFAREEDDADTDEGAEDSEDTDGD